MRNLYLLLLGIQLVTVQVFDGGLVGEIFRIPRLIAHYAEHHLESDGEMGLAEFLYLHYLDRDHREQDSTHHSSLPFSSTHTHWLIQWVQPAGEKPYDFRFCNSTSYSRFHRAPDLDAGKLLSVWQPPDLI
ncbi:MAG: hypothetical protein JNM00_02450 [Flavobacteriales bacterium]|nr:hypothetical protein [Flavobacteriales bacterium]